ncbi:MAG TPA: hypothetical protein PLU18_08615 [Ferruginibacter sp.]|nr:hypothetical protein [Ferruginibacter sp.]HRC03177.1 hypothetical protein [Niabella sp.]
MEATAQQPTATHLQHLLRAAINAHRGTSFSPEKRGEQLIKDYDEQLTGDLEQIKEASSETKETYKARYIKYLNAYLSARSRIISPMISGPSNFPTRRMQKYNGWEDNAYKAFSEFREKALKGIKKQIQNDKPEEQKQDEAWKSIEKSILSSAATIIAIDNGESCYTRSLFVNSITGLIKRMAANGQTGHVKKAIELIRLLNGKYAKPIITEKNSIFTLLEVAEAAAETKRDEANMENQIFEFEGGEVVLNYEIDRVQITHHQKPTKEHLNELKAKGLNTFNFSFQNVAWQRKITRDAIAAACRITGAEIPY